MSVKVGPSPDLYWFSRGYQLVSCEEPRCAWNAHMGPVIVEDATLFARAVEHDCPTRPGMALLR